MRTVIVATALALSICAASASGREARVGLPDFSYLASISPYAGNGVACVARDGDTALPWRMAGVGSVGGLDWAPDGGRFVVAFGKRWGTGIRIAPADPSGGLRALTAPRRKTEDDSGPDWSPDGSNVAFVRDVSYGPGVDYRRFGLWVVDVETRREAQVMRSLPDAFDWSPSGDRLVVSSAGDLIMFAANGRRIWTISRNADGVKDVAWSPAGDLIAARFGQEILLTTPDRTPVATIQLQQHELQSLERGLSWSPDGLLLAVGGGAIFDRAGHPLRRYAEPSTRAAVATDPRWTPDGTAIVFRRAPAVFVSSRYSTYLLLGAADLYLWQSSGGDPVQLTSTPPLDEYDVVFRPGHARGTAGALPCFYLGTSERDVVYGTDADDLVLAGAGNDIVYGSGGDDHILAGPGDDVLRPGRGGDVVAAGAGNDRINSRDGERDWITGGRGRDRAKVDRRDAVAGVETVLRRR